MPSSNSLHTYIPTYINFIARYKKTVSRILLVQLALVTCYVLFGMVLMLSAFEIGYVAFRAMETLLFLNSSLNPILYC